MLGSLPKFVFSLKKINSEPTKVPDHFEKSVNQFIRLHVPNMIILVWLSILYFCFINIAGNNQYLKLMGRPKPEYTFWKSIPNREACSQVVRAT